MSHSPTFPPVKCRWNWQPDPIFGQVWKYTLRADTTIEASGLISAETGTVVTYNRTIHPGARPQNPVLTMGNARQIADSTINDRNTGILSINMSDSRYVPLSTPGGNVAGSYRFVFNRIIQDYPCDADGFIVSVDAVSGAVTEWVQHWESPDNAFMILDTPIVPRYDAIYAVQAKAKTIYPASIGSLHIVSAERSGKTSMHRVPHPGRPPSRWHGRLSSMTKPSGDIPRQGGESAGLTPIRAKLSRSRTSTETGIFFFPCPSRLVRVGGRAVYFCACTVRQDTGFLTGKTMIFSSREVVPDQMYPPDPPTPPGFSQVFPLFLRREKYGIP